MGALAKVRDLTARYGAMWTGLYAARAVALRMAEVMESRLLVVERNRFLVGAETMSAIQYSAHWNARTWGRYDWSRGGEEWTPSPEWKRRMRDELILKHVNPGADILEIGPGAGRWSELLQSIAGHLTLVDVSEECLALCRARFEGRANVSYHLTTGSSLSFVPGRTVDFIWSFDVFVHVNPVDIDRYLRELARVLRPGGRGVIHHAARGSCAVPGSGRGGWRTNMTDRFFAELVHRHGMVMLGQSSELAHKAGDVISIFEKPAVSQEPGGRV